VPSRVSKTAAATVDAARGGALALTERMTGTCVEESELIFTAAPVLLLFGWASLRVSLTKILFII